MKRILATVLLAIVGASVFALPQKVDEDGQEILTPFVVREIAGWVHYAEGKPLRGAHFEIGLKDEMTLATDTDGKGEFRLRGFRLIGPFVRSVAISPGTYSFKVTKDGFHSAVGAVVV